jgi:hypothetical protein
MAQRIRVVSFGHIDVRTENGDVVGLVMSATNETGPVELEFSAEAARHFLRQIGVFAQTVPEI